MNNKRINRTKRKLKIQALSYNMSKTIKILDNHILALKNCVYINMELR